MLAGALLDRQVAVRVVMVVPPNAPAPRLEASLRQRGVETTMLRLAGRAYAREATLLRREAETWRAGVVHTHGYRPDVVAGWAARRAGIPTVATIHGFTGGGWRNRAYEWVQRRALRRFDAVVAVSAPLRERLQRSGVRPERVHLIPNAGASGQLLKSRAEARRTLGLPPDGAVVGWVGRVEAEKGPDVMLEAVRRLARAEVTVAVVGEGRLRPELERQSRDYRLPVRWLGLVPEVDALYAAFDCLVLSSHTEGTPIVLFEAMAAGVPIVTTRVGGVPDVVTSAEALLVPAADPTALAAGIAAVLDEPEKARARADAASTRLVERFGTGPWVEQYLALYRRLIPSTRSLASHPAR
jgi:glycosyltransferase involved in cell wall biosynthesis